MHRKVYRVPLGARFVEAIVRGKPAPSVAIRDFEPGDYPSIVEINNLLYPEHPATVDETVFEDEQYDRSKYLWRRLVAMDASSRVVVGESTFHHIPWAFDPQRFQVWIGVHPQWQGRGIGALLYERSLEELRSKGARQVRTWTQETQAETLAFLQRRGFRELHRSWESRLEVTAFDRGKFADRWDVPEGIEVTTLAAERAVGLDCLRAVYEMDTELGPDIPMVDPYTPIRFEFWRGHVEGPGALPEAFFLAKDGGRYVGQSDLRRSETLADVLYTGFTGVLGEYRGKGIAFALKLRAIDYARRHGIREIRTWNSSLNAPMLGINLALGFEKAPAWLTLGTELVEAP